MDYDKLNKYLGLKDETIENIKDFVYKTSRLNIRLSKEDKALCKSYGIKKRLAKIVKFCNEINLQPLPDCHEYGEIDFESKADGICALYDRKNNDPVSEIHRVVYRNKLKYLKKGYNLFCFGGEKNGLDYMALVKGKTDLEILKWRKTHGINHNIDNPALIAKIEEWQQKYDFVLCSCGRDELQIYFLHEEPSLHDQAFGLPNEVYNKKYKLWKERTPNFKKFADEVADFCPDLITQVYGSKNKLIKQPPPKEVDFIKR